MGRQESRAKFCAGDGTICPGTNTPFSQEMEGETKQKQIGS